MKTAKRISPVLLALAAILSGPVLTVKAASDEIAYDNIHPTRAIVATIIAVVVALVIFIYRNWDLISGSRSKEDRHDFRDEYGRVGWIPKAFLVMFLDVLIILGSYLLALMLRFDFTINSIPAEYFYGYRWSMLFWVVATIVDFYAFRLYHSIWSLASLPEVVQSLKAYIALLIVYPIGVLFMGLRMPRSYYFMGYVICFILTVGMRFSYRFLRSYLRTRSENREKGQGSSEDRIMVIGGGAAGQALIRDLLRRASSRVCCIIDDNPSKRGRTLEGIPIVGNREDIPDAVRQYDVNHIIYAIPAASEKDRKDILNICQETGCRLQTVPSLNQLVNGEVTVQRLRDVDITDLLGRAQVEVNDQEIKDAIHGKVILVTGGGGSIGSELCRQIAAAGVGDIIGATKRSPEFSRVSAA